MATKKKTAQSQTTQPTPVVVTTKHRGVFFGYLDGEIREQTDGTSTVRITKVRNCLFWSRDVRGFLGLAATGPTPSCRVGPAAPAATLTEVTSVTECSPEAAQRWESGPWSA